MFWLSFIMELDTLFFFSICFILCASATNFDRKKAFDDLDQDLEFVDSAKQISFLKKKVVDAQEKVAAKDIQLEEALIQLGDALKDKMTCYGYVRDATCGKRIRFYMETFGVSQGVKKGDYIPQSEGLKAALNRIKLAIKCKRNKIATHVYYLQVLYHELRGLSPYSIGFSSSNESIAWCLKVKQQFYRMQKVHINRRQPDKTLQHSYTRNLSDLITEFNSAKDADDAVTVFRNQCLHCFWLSESIDINEPSEIKKLVLQWSDNETNDLIPELGHEGLTPQEHKFLKGIMATGNYFILENKTFKHCTNVFYFGTTNIENLRKNLMSEWDEKDLAVLVEKFCSSFSQLYDLISITDIHTLPPLPDECKPNATDYEKYFKNIVEEPETQQNYIVIAKILGLMKSTTNK